MCFRILAICSCVNVCVYACVVAVLSVIRVCLVSVECVQRVCAVRFGFGWSLGEIWNFYDKRSFKSFIH